MYVRDSTDRSQRVRCGDHDGHPCGSAIHSILQHDCQPSRNSLHCSLGHDWACTVVHRRDSCSQSRSCLGSSYKHPLYVSWRVRWYYTLASPNCTDQHSVQHGPGRTEHFWGPYPRSFDDRSWIRMCLHCNQSVCSGMRS